MAKIKFLILFLSVSILLPGTAGALEMPSVQNGWLGADLSARSYVVIDKATGATLLQKDAGSLWTPASLTKLVTALVFLDTKPNLKKIVSIKQSDQVGGGCSAGGACIYTKPGVSYRLNDLFNASLVASANNATFAVARSTGLSNAEFIKRMNQKAKDLGAYNTVFVEPSGMDPANISTVSDFAKIVEAAFNNSTIKQITGKKTYAFKSTNNKRYSHNLKNTNKLLGDGDLAMALGKTGFLDESRYNFAAEVKDRVGNTMIVVLFGSRSSAMQFQETKQLAQMGGLALAFGGGTASVLGTSTETSLAR